MIDINNIEYYEGKILPNIYIDFWAFCLSTHFSFGSIPSVNILARTLVSIVGANHSSMIASPAKIGAAKHTLNSMVDVNKIYNENLSNFS